MNRIAVLIVFVCMLPSQSARAIEFLFGEPARLGPPLSSSKSDVGHLSRDGLSFYVSQGNNFGPAELSVSRRASVNDSWGPLEDMEGGINEDRSVGIVSTTADEQSMFFSGKIGSWSGSVRRNGLGGGDIWQSERGPNDSSFGEPINVGAPINTRYLEADPTVSADGLVMIFASGRPNGFGSVNLWESRRSSVDAPWQEPEVLGAHINHKDEQYSPALSGDGLTLFYASYASGGPFGDIWVASRDDLTSPWSAPLNLGGKVNTASYEEFNPQLSTDGSSLFLTQWTIDKEFDLIEVPLLPFEAVPLITGTDGYFQDFDDALGSDGGARGTNLPTGWTASDNGTIFTNATDQAFPVRSSLGSGGNPILNAGAEGQADRTLAIGAKDRTEGGMLQLLADVSGNEANSVQLQFDIEAWDARTHSRTDDPGEGAFKVHLDIDRGNGFELLADLGTVTTGLLATPTDAYLDGNAAENRVSFNSGPLNSSIPAGSKLRVRWNVDRDARTNNWVFGLDNVHLTLFDTPGERAGDFNQDGILDIDDLTALTAAIRSFTTDSSYDVDHSGTVDLQDRIYWVTDLKKSWIGDSNLDGQFDSGDLVDVFKVGTYESDVDAGWSDGDWNGDNRFDSGDLVAAFKDGGYEAGPRTAVAAVPEPSSMMLLCIGILGTVRRGARCRATLVR